jgi:4-azaleucine resistance transporter AzlC
MIYAVTALAAGIPPILVQAMSIIVFAGSAQFVIVQLVAAGAPGLVILITAFVINLRHLLYSASVAPYMQRLAGLWKPLLAYLLTDEAYAVAITRYQQETEQQHGYWYFLGAGFALWFTWQLSTAAGIFLGKAIPTSLPLDFTGTLTFIALVVPALKNRASVAAACAAGLTALLVFSLPLKSGIVVAALVGISVGLAFPRVQKGEYQ